MSEALVAAAADRVHARDGRKIIHSRRGKNWTKFKKIEKLFEVEPQGDSFQRKVGEKQEMTTIASKVFCFFEQEQVQVQTT